MRRWGTLVVVVAAIFMLLIDITVVNVALPQIEQSLGASFTELQWVIDAYSLALATFVLNAGAVADLVGRKKVFVTGLVAFTAASVTCGLATSPLFLILSRGAQGLGGSIMFATSLAILAQEYTGRDRGVAFGAWGATAGAAVAVGPVVGGALTSWIGWEWIFFVNGPIGIVTALGALRFLRDTRDPDARRPDWAGMVTLAGGIFLLVYALLRGNDNGWTSAVTLSCFAGAAVLLTLFVIAQAVQERPMVDLALFRRPAFVGAQLTAFLLSLSFFGLFLYLALYLQNVLGYSPLDAGLRLLPVSVSAFLVAPVAGRLSAAVPVRLMLGVGLGLIGAGLLLLTGISAGSGWTALVAGFVVSGIGLGLTNPPLASTAIGVAPQSRSGMASGVNNMFRQVGIATGVAALGAVFQSRVHSDLTSALAGMHGLSDRVSGSVASGSFGGVLHQVPPNARAQVAAAARSAFVDGLTTLFWISAAIALAGAVLAVVLVRSSDFEQHERPQPAGADRSGDRRREHAPVA
jgi:EmrB/QacA subfamily drug resistance transporter